MQTEGFSAIHAHRSSAIPAAAATVSSSTGSSGAAIGRFPVLAQHGLVATVAYIMQEEGVRGLFSRASCWL
jgi:hypothetical protein